MNMTMKFIKILSFEPYFRKEWNQMITNLFLARHGQTEWNLERRIQGQLDSPLTPLGMKQAKKLGDQIRHISLQCIYSSSSKRAWDTASYVRGDRKIDIMKTDRLMEMSFANWEGRKWSEIQRLHPDEWKTMHECPEQYEAKSAQGETYWEVEKRIVTFVEEMLKKHSGENILLISHGIAIKVLINYYSGRGIALLKDQPHIIWATLYQLSFLPDEVRLFLEGKEIGCSPYRARE